MNIVRPRKSKLLVENFRKRSLLYLLLILPRESWYNFLGSNLQYTASRLSLNEAATMKFVTAGTKDCANIFLLLNCTKDRSRALG